MRIYCFNIAVDNVSQDEALKLVQKFLNDGKQHYIVTPNPEMVVLASKDLTFRDALLRANLALVDGFGLILALRLAGYRLKERVTGSDFLNLIFAGVPKDTSFFFLGGENGVAKEAAKNVHAKYGINIVGTNEPPKGGVYSMKGEIFIINHPLHDRLIKHINKVKPDFLVVALGHGQQEKWLAKFLSYCPSVKVGIGVGGALDYLANRVVRAPWWMRRIGLEWSWRFVYTPSRWRRIFTATIVFLIKTVGWLLSMKFKYRPLTVGCIINKKGEILLVERAGVPNHWQFPQGGREPDETPSNAVLREMAEELNLTNLTIIGQSKPDVYKYRWQKIWSKNDSDTAKRKLYHVYAGQSVTVFYLKFDGKNDTVKVDQHELVDFRWVTPNKLLDFIHPVRRSLAKIIIKDLRRLGLITN